MKCEWVRENIVLQVYGELADDARHELEQHVARCADCAAELKAEQDFHALLAQDRAADPTPNLLAASRMRLQEALETAKQGSVWSRLGVRSGELAAADAILPGSGFGDSDSRFCRRNWNHLQALRTAAQLQTAGAIATTTRPQFPPKHPSPASIPSFRIPERIRSASSTTPCRTQEKQGSLNDQTDPAVAALCGPQ